MPKRPITVLFLALAALLGAVCCSHDAKVIPTAKMEEIYREMFLADEWIKANPEKRPSADTSWVYRPIFEKYGYTYQDYLNTVDHLLNDPNRYAELVGRVAKGLENETEAVKRSIRKRDDIRHRADSIAEIIRSGVLKDYFLYENLFLVVSRTDTIDISRNTDGVYYPKPVIADTMFKGPGMVFADTSGISADSLVLAVKPESEETGTPEEEATVRDVPKLTTRQVRPSSAGRFPSVEVSRFQVVEDKEGKISFEKSEQQPASGSGTLKSPKLKRGPRPKKTDR